MKVKLIYLGVISLVLSACSPNGFSPSASSTGSNGPLDDDHPPIENTTTFLKLKNQVLDFRARYTLADPFEKLVDNRGDKYSGLYGVRNFRVVLHGVYYRGGANNTYNKVDGVRSNENPLPASGLKNLCQQGFKEAIYLYVTNYSTSPKSASCATIKGESNVLNYQQISALSYTNNEKFLEKVYEVIRGQRQGPIYGHCWNGWHASGYVSAVLLKQFCGYSDQQALDYWKSNTDGNADGYEPVMKKVVAFKPMSKFQITAEEAQLICP